LPTGLASWGIIWMAVTRLESDTALAFIYILRSIDQIISYKHSGGPSPQQVLECAPPRARLSCPTFIIKLFHQVCRHSHKQ
jgi:hypothetical protein